MTKFVHALGKPILTLLENYGSAKRKNEINTAKLNLNGDNNSNTTLINHIAESLPMKSSRLVITVVVVVAIAAMGGYYLTLPREAPQQVQQPVKETPKEVAQPPVEKPLEIMKVKSGNSFATSEQFYLVETIGVQQGIFKKNSLEPEFVPLAGSARLFEAVNAGEIDIGLGVVGDIIAAKANGVPVKLVATHIAKSSWAIYVDGKGPIKTPQDLNSKKIGVTGVKGIAHLMGVTFAKKYNIKPEFAPLGGAPQNLAALQAGQIDAFVQAAGFSTRFVESGELRVIEEMGNLLPAPWAEYGVFATEKIMQNNPELVKRYVKSVQQTVQYLRDNPDMAAGIFADKSKSPANIAQKAIARIDWNPSGSIDEKALTNVFETYKAGEEISPSTTLTIKDVYDTRFLK